MQGHQYFCTEMNWHVCISEVPIQNWNTTVCIHYRRLNEKGVAKGRHDFVVKTLDWDLGDLGSIPSSVTNLLCASGFVMHVSLNLSVLCGKMDVIFFFHIS